MKSGTQASRPLEFLKGGGELAEVMRGTDWSKTALGPIAGWPQSLLTALSVMLTAPQPSYIFWGPELAILYNDLGLPFVGTKHPACLGHSIRDVLKEAWPVLGPLVEGVVATGVPVFLENLLIPLERIGFLQDGYFTFSYIPIRNEAAEVGGILVVVNETTERVLGERRLALIRELSLRAALCQSVASVLQSVEEVLARAQNDVPFALLYEVRGERARLVVSAGIEPGHLAAPLELELGQPGGWPLGAVRDAGEQHVEELPTTFGPLPGSTSGEPAQRAFLLPLAGESEQAGYVLVAGLNPRYVFDEDARSFLQLLARQVATSITSTRALEEKTQRAAQLAELDRQKTEFFSNVSHEFRTPLTLMLGPIEDGLADVQQPLPPAQRERIELVRRNGLRLQKLVNTLLDFARIEAGRARASFVPSDLSAFTRALASSFESAMASAGIGLVVDCPPLPAPVYVDPTLWEKIVLNLLSNALKFTFEGAVTVSMSWRGASVELLVRDTGTGIPEDELPRVFDRFHRVHGARSRSHEGTGIGLALVKELVGLHGGDVQVTSALGQGTTFTVSVPTGLAHLPPLAVQPAAPTLMPTGIGADSFLAEVAQWDTEGPAAGALGAPLTSHGHGDVPGSVTPPSAARVLIADDNADMRKYLSGLLSRHWAVETVSDGRQAIVSAQANPPDLIVSDVMMPGVTGLELVKALRADARTRAVPVILLSARAGEEATIEGLQHGANEYLVKPFSANELIARVSAQLTVSQLRQAAVHDERTHAEEARRLLAESQHATRSREETLAIVSHDLRNPLNSISLAAELLARAVAGDGNAQTSKYVDTIRHSARRMGRLISDLLDLGSIDTGTLSIQRGPQRVEDIVAELQQMFEPLALQKGLQLAAHVEPSLPPIDADKERLIQALGSLVSNSLKFTREGSISIRARRHPQGIAFSVSDTGSGIAPDALSRIFDRYWHSAQAGREGHGLGLAIARGIVEAHGGGLRAESVLGQGSTLTLVLPLEITPGSAVDAARSSPPVSRPALSTPDFLAGGGEMGQLIRALDWSTTPLGAVEHWPQSLRTTVSLCLASSFPISLAWGPQHIQIYNDGYLPICGGKHPHSLGQDFSECWASAWPVIGEAFERALAGETQFLEDQRTFLDRNGYLEEVFFTFSFSPIRDETGGIGGLFHPVTETTSKMLSERRTRSLRELAARTSKAKTPDDAFELAAQAVAGDELDIPFMLFYAVDGAAKEARLAASTGLALPSAAAPEAIDLSAGTSSWSVAEVVQSGALRELDDVAARLGTTACGAYPEPPQRALLLPITLPGGERPAAVIVAGVSPRLRLDDAYRSFYDLAASTITAALANARAYEEERKRSEALVEVDRAKTTFFSNVSHEFRTPLTALSLSIFSLIAKIPTGTPADTATQRASAVVERQLDRLKRQVEELVDLAGLLSGSLQLTLEELDASEVVASVIEERRSWAPERDLSIHLDAAAPVPCRADRGRLRQLVSNLLDNAIEFGAGKPVEVSVRREGAQVSIEVQDHGSGIAPADQERIFGRFERAAAVVNHGGFGLGLWVTRLIAEAHGGTVRVTTTEGGGATFITELPAAG